MLRFGIVSQINPITVEARVNFEEDESTSYWLPVLQTKTLKDKFYAISSIVMVFSHGVVFILGYPRLFYLVSSVRDKL